MVRQKRRRMKGTDTEPASVKALHQENEELREEVEKLREEVERLREENEELREERDRSREGNEGNEEMKLAKLEAGCQTPQEEKEEVKLPTLGWVIVAGKIDENDVCSFALVSRQLREAQVLAGRKLVTRLTRREYGYVSYFTEDWCAYWSRTFDVRYTDPKLIKLVLYVAAHKGYLQVFEKYWSQGPQKKLSKLWDERTCYLAARSGHLELVKWLRAKGCPWDGGDDDVCRAAAEGGQLEVLQWIRAQDPPCPWDVLVCSFAARYGHLDVLRWARSQGCPWDEYAPWAAARKGHLKVLKWLIKEGCPYDKSWCRGAAVEGGERARKVLEWLDELPPQENL